MKLKKYITRIQEEEGLEVEVVLFVTETGILEAGIPVDEEEGEITKTLLILLLAVSINASNAKSGFAYLYLAQVIHLSYNLLIIFIILNPLYILRKYWLQIIIKMLTLYSK